MDLLVPVAAVAVLSGVAGAACLLGAIRRPAVRVVMGGTTLVLGLLCLVSSHVLSAGGVLVRDPSGTAFVVHFVAGNHATELRRLGGGFFYGEPEGESGLVMGYANGVVAECGGYYEPGTPNFVTLKPPPRC